MVSKLNCEPIALMLWGAASRGKPLKWFRVSTRAALNPNLEVGENERLKVGGE